MLRSRFRSSSTMRTWFLFISPALTPSPTTTSHCDFHGFYPRRGLFFVQTDITATRAKPSFNLQLYFYFLPFLIAYLMPWGSGQKTCIILGGCHKLQIIGIKKGEPQKYLPLFPHEGFFYKFQRISRREIMWPREEKWQASLWTR